MLIEPPRHVIIVKTDRGGDLKEVSFFRHLTLYTKLIDIGLYGLHIKKYGSKLHYIVSEEGRE